MRREFPKKVKLAAWDRCGGKCDRCGNKIVAGNGPEYNHRLPDYLGGEPTLENCEVLCIKPCHRTVTSEQDRPVIDKARRVMEKRIGVRSRKSRPMPGSRASGFRKRMDGSVERR